MRRTAFAIAAAALIAGAISAVPQSPALAAPGATPTISITARSPFAKVTNDVYVRFRLDTMKSATIQGKVVGAAHGEDLRLYAQPFPFKQPPAKVADLAIGSATMPYSFRVTPRLATRYRAKLFRTSSSGTALAASAKVTVYAAATRRARGGSMCQRPVCHQTWHLHVLVPSSTLRTEMPKRWFIYFGLRLTRGEPWPPNFLKLGAGNPRVSKPRKISSHEYAVTIKLSFRIGNEQYFYEFNPCQRDSESKDGFNLPGHHGCGTLKAISSSPRYLG
jgi:hypothetical protein